MNLLVFRRRRGRTENGEADKSERSFKQDFHCIFPCCANCHDRASRPTRREYGAIRTAAKARRGIGLDTRALSLRYQERPEPSCRRAGDFFNGLLMATATAGATNFATSGEVNDQMPDASSI